jgi:YidC/Oxa1 family membrane protein insertase
MEFVALIWNEIITRPMTNSLMVLYVLFAGNLGLSIIAFTIVVRGMTFPLVRRQLRQTKKMQELQPRIKAINEKFKSDPKLRGSEVMKAYRETGVNPVGCLGPLVIQMPIFIGLFWAINNVLPFTPENLAGLYSKLYSFLPFLDAAVPVDRHFLGMDLGLEPTRDKSILAYALVGISGLSMFVQQKMTQTNTGDPAQMSQQKMMTVMFPVMFGMFSLFFPIGLVIYWVASNLIGIFMQYFITGWGSLKPQPAGGAPAPGTGSRLGPTLTGAQPDKEQGDGGEKQHREDGEDGGRGDRASTPRTRRRPRRGGGRRRQ